LASPLLASSAASAVLLLDLSSAVLWVLLMGLSSASTLAVLLIGLASVFLASAVLFIGSSASVLRTKPLSSVLVLLLGSWCFGAAPDQTYGVLFIGKFFCCYLRHSIHALQFTNLTSTPFTC
jgi:hypothetical protein